ncbi:hypothetical protein FP2506_18309 [Fulvimarina pelagi HTCC2506]|uniref:HTH marR-type domain-containing protein n=2 Tax=Fulvimarina pelagi TaxID=217511 RepID=Q0G0X1_9HYPH|nr:hypothetical protein FP2506_18309 [Fulvimarina pelagi HTCC2506]
MQANKSLHLFTHMTNTMQQGQTYRKNSPLLGILVSDIARRVRHDIQRRMRDRGYELTLVALTVLAQTFRTDGISAEKISEMAGLWVDSVNFEIERFVREDVLTVQIMAGKSILHLGPNAGRLVDAFYHAVQESHSALLNGLSRSERADLIRMLTIIQFPFTADLGRRSTAQ